MWNLTRSKKGFSCHLLNFETNKPNKTDFANNEHAVAIVFDFEKSYDTNVKIPFYDTNVKYPILHETNIKNLI